MRHFVKGAAPASFDDWKAGANDAWQPSYGGLQNPQKRHLHQALLDEQGKLCCYCGRAVTLADSHIEHFRPQEQRGDLALDFQNLFASCIRETKPGAPLHCGHAKGHDFNETLHVSPLDPTCEHRFTYTLDGAILPRDAGATYMVSLLKLDIEFLRHRRGEALASVFDAAFIASVTDDELRQLAQAYRGPDSTGTPASFGHVLARFAEQMLEGAA
ncbi:retron system putative HNH endonuclease [Derxia lacustris]|uniref:retron system putative HNH endonuclease n=1 Tax=Derxia lacustris TaxID=764842 RepID=UPI000A17581E|nr:retron system putative HNH endonuclease [Derxia lacustris]